MFVTKMLERDIDRRRVREGKEKWRMGKKEKKKRDHYNYCYLYLNELNWGKEKM